MSVSPTLQAKIEPMTIRTEPALEQYVKTILASRLITRTQMEEVFHKLEGQPRLTSIDLAVQLQQAGLLTAWQNKNLFRGRSKGFFLNHYKLLDCLGHGGMGVVYRGEHTMMKRQVAIKVLPADQTANSLLERFRVECQAIGSLNHPNIILAHDFNITEKYFYLVMEYVPGPTLDQLVEQSGPLAPNLVSDYIRQAADALAYVHEAGVIHRDIKPGNFILAPGGVVKLLDLGLARMQHSQELSITMASGAEVLGTLDFMAPEQAMDSHKVGPLADLYSLGCTMYFLLTGKPPFASGTPAERMMSHLCKTPEPPTALRPDVPLDLQAICLKLLAKMPEERFASAAMVSQVLRARIQPKQTSPSALDTMDVELDLVESSVIGKSVDLVSSSTIDSANQFSTTGRISTTRNQSSADGLVPLRFARYLMLDNQGTYQTGHCVACKIDYAVPSTHPSTTPVCPKCETRLELSGSLPNP